jgi:hypothetical protein
VKKKLLHLFSFAVCCGLMLLGARGIAAAQGVPTPEIDPASAASGIAMLVGAALVLIERVRSR